MEELARYIKKFILRIFLAPFRVFPIKKNQILLINDLARTYSGNPKCISEYLRKNYPQKFRIIFSVQAPQRIETSLNKDVHLVKFNSLKYFYYGMTSKVIVSNSGGYSYLPLRRCQYVINTGHGGGAYKKMGIYMFNDSYFFRKDLQLSARKTNVYLSTNRRYTDVVSASLLMPRDIFWEIGMPRNDMMIQNDEKIREHIKIKIGLSQDEKLVLFAPTYRKPKDNYFKESIAISYGIDSARVCGALEKRFGGKWRFAIRLHPRIFERKNIFLKGMIDLTDYEDMQELLLATDVLINDFSSSMWDFMLTGRPCFLFAKDLEHYIQTTDVYTPVSEWPFPMSTNNDDLEKNILEFDLNGYLEHCKRHYENLGGCETGEATKLTCEKIYNICLSH